jgi:hypothetical protein
MTEIKVPAVVEKSMQANEVALGQYGSFILTANSFTGMFTAHHVTGDDELRPSRNWYNERLSKLKETLDRFSEKGWAKPKRERPNVPCKLRWQGRIIDAIYTGIHLGQKKLTFLIDGKKTVVGEQPDFYPASTPQTAFDALRVAANTLAKAEHVLSEVEVPTTYIAYHATREEMVALEQKYAKALTK